ncbi:MAG: glycosyltransferase family 39 protein [Chloroflexota bacterium]
MNTISAPSRKNRLGRTAALLAVLALAAFLHLYRLEQEGFGNLYYAAAVRSMLGSAHNFFFASFDPAGFVTVDKPPLGLWVQAASAFVFGFQGWSLLLPQALAGIASVGLLYWLVERTFGWQAGLLAALVLALTPVSVAANRNNTMDSLLVLTSLLAAWAASLAAERGRLRWLLVCALLLGTGFNIKMLQAFLVLPACLLIYCLAPLPRWKRLLHLGLALLVLGVVSLTWVLTVDATPSEQRPFIGSSHNNSVLELVIGHNGAARLGEMLPFLNKPQQPPPGRQRVSIPPYGSPSGPVPGAAPAPFSGETGQPGALRLFNPQLAGQASWLLPLALLALLVAARQPQARQPAWKIALLLWSAWLLPQVVFFSYAGLFHRYYLEMLSPAIAALSGAGLASLWRDYRRALFHVPEDENVESATARRNLLGAWGLPLALLGSAAVAIYILQSLQKTPLQGPPLPAWVTWMIPLVLALSLSSVTGLVVLLVLREALRAAPGLPARQNGMRLARTLACLGLLGLLAAPAAWSFTPLLYGGDSGLPYAGPELARRGPPANPVQPTPLVHFLLAEHHQETFILGVINARTAAPVILATGEAVMAMGGFSGGDHILSLPDLQAMLAARQVRFFLLPGLAPPSAPVPQQQPLPPNQPQPVPLAPPEQAELVRWIQATCHIVPEPVWNLIPGKGWPPQPGILPGLDGPHQLWDCARR